MITSSAVAWNMAFCACAARTVIMSAWWLSVAPKVGAPGERRGICPSCGARRMAESGALLVDDVLPHQPIRQWVLSFPFQLRFLLSSYPEIMGKVLGIVQRVLSTHLIKAAPAYPCAHGISASMHVKAGLTRATGQTGSVTPARPVCFNDSGGTASRRL